MEAVVVIVITGIISAIVAIFIKAPIQGYFDTARRAEMTDAADTAARRIARDLRLALPNSVRVTGGGTALEFLSTRDGGRYRADFDNAGAGNPLDFANPIDTTFDILGQQINFQAGDQIVIYNLGLTGSDAYSGNTLATDNRRAYTGAPGLQSVVTMSSTKAFPFDSPTHRFQVVDTPVTYICNGGTLWRYWGYSIQPAQTSVDTVAKLDALVAPATATRGSAQLAQNSTCTFEYTSGVSQTSALVTIRLTLTKSAETVSLYHAVHVNNVP